MVQIHPATLMTHEETDEDSTDEHSIDDVILNTDDFDGTLVIYDLWYDGMEEVYEDYDDVEVRHNFDD
jgi:hypothetical protein